MTYTPIIGDSSLSYNDNDDIHNPWKSPPLPYENNDPDVTIVHIPRPKVEEQLYQGWNDFTDNMEHYWEYFIDSVESFADSVQSIF